MTFASELRKAKGNLTAKQVAEAVDNAVSVRTIEDWLAGRHTPHKWQQNILLGRLATLTGQPPVRTVDGCKTAEDVTEYLAQESVSSPKKAQSRKSQNNKVG